jgi:O-antigen ligase
MVNRMALPGVPPAALESEQSSPMQRIVFFFAMALIFIRFSMIHQIQTMTMGVNLYLLYIFGIPALFGILATGGIRRTLQQRPGVYWALFGVWLLVAFPFSTWKGGSAIQVTTYLRTDLLMVFVCAAAVTWRDCRRFMIAIAFAAIVSLAASQLFSRVDNNERIQLNFGTVANSNDYAGHLILVLPFLLWVIMSGQKMVYRIIAFVLLPYGLYVILATASRGALVAIGAGVVYALIAGRTRQRVAMFLLSSIMLMAAISFLPQRTWQRLTSFSQTGAASEEAMESSHDREYLLRKSLTYIVENPIFGLGTAQFSAYEGKTSREKGQFGAWHDTHNTYTQIASENGLPALFFFVAGIISPMILLTRVHRTAKNLPGFREIEATAFCMMLSLVSFCTAITFLNFGYLFYLPAMAGLAISVYNTAQLEFRKAAAAPLAGVAVAAAQPDLRPKAWTPQRAVPQRLAPQLKPSSPARPSPLGPTRLR